MKAIAIIGSIAFFVGVLIVGYLVSQRQQDGDYRTTKGLVIGVPNWPAARAKAHIIKQVIEDNLAVTVELQTGSNAVIFAGIDSGAIDVHPAVWLPNQANLHQKYVIEKGTAQQAKTPQLGNQYMCVTKSSAQRTGIVELSDLANPKIASQFDRDGDGKGELWIGASGWASTIIEKVRAKSYGYDQTMNLKEMDEALALAELDNAVNNNNNIVFYCDKPHYTFLLYELVILKEPPHDSKQWYIVQPHDDPNWLAKSSARSAWDRTRVYVYYATSLTRSSPAVAKLLHRVTFDADSVSKMNYALVVEKIPPDEFAINWTKTQTSVIDSWLK